MNKLEKIKLNYPKLLEEQTCEICGKHFYLTKSQLKNYFNKLIKNKQIHYYCSRICCSKLQNKLLGNPFSRQDIKDKIKIKRLNDLDENGNNSYKRAAIKGLETKRNDIDKDGLNGCQRILKKNRIKCKELYNVENCFSSKDPKLNGRSTKKERYGDENYTNRKQAMKTNKKNHGGKHNWASNDPKLNGRKTRKEKYGDEYWSNRQQAKETTFIKYGKEYYTETEEFKRIKFEKLLQSQKKEYETKKKNKTFNISNLEQKCYNLLKIKYPNTIHTYRDDKRYPFNCDFYIPELDLFIECHFGWRHGKEPFDDINEHHIKIINNWKKKAEEININGKKKKSYLNAIYQWTKLDPKKLKTFQDNHLNYKIFYTEKDFNNWFDSL